MDQLAQDTIDQIERRLARAIKIDSLCEGGQGYSYSEIGQILGLSTATVGRIFLSGMAKLRNELQCDYCDIVQALEEM